MDGGVGYSLPRPTILYEGENKLITAQILIGDVRQRLAEIPDASVQTCITSPPYWGLRDYGVDGQIGLEQSPDDYVAQLVEVFREVRRVLADDGTLWLNLGDSYAANSDGNRPQTQIPHDKSREGYHRNEPNKIASGSGRKRVPANLKPKDLVGIPWRVAFALQADGWWLRQDIIWHKPNPMPESVIDRCTKAHEYVFLLTKSSRYHYDRMAISEKAIYAEQHAAKSTSWGTKRKHPNKNNVEKYAFVGNNKTTLEGGQKNKRSVWTINTKPFKGAHFAVMPEALVEPCILAGSREGDLVLDPFTGAGTTAVVALRHGRNFIGTELNKEYAQIAQERLENEGSLFHQVIVK